MNRVTNLILICCFATIICGINACNEKIAVPYYVHIDSASVENVDYSTHGSVSSKITDVWIYADNKLAGAYTLPANIPVISNSKSIDIRAGISENGINNRRMAYPLYYLKNITADWPAGTYKKINPAVKYLPNVKLQIHEDFEIGTNFETQNTSAIINTVTDSNKLEGSASGAIYLDNANPVMDIIINKDLILPAGQTCFLEFNYKTNVNLEINFVCITNTTTTTNRMGNLFAKPQWNKVYFNVANLTETFKANRYKLNIRAILPAAQSTGYVLLDNVKLLTVQ